jgi:hypothetical protein
MNFQVIEEIERYSINQLIEMPDEQLADLSRQVDATISHVMVVKSWLRGVMILRQAENNTRGGKY